MKLYFDTSALVKFFHEEEGTQKVTRPYHSNGVYLHEPSGKVTFMAKEENKRKGVLLLSGFPGQAGEWQDGWRLRAS
jgi:hypothetical protein